MRDFLISYRNVERAAELCVVSFPCKVEDGFRSNNGNRCRVLSHHPHMHTFCRLDRPVDKADSCCTFRYRTGIHLSLERSNHELWNF